MPTPKKKRKKTKRKGTFELSVYQFVRLKKKNENPNDTTKRIKARPPSDVAPTFRIKIRKK